MLKSITLNNVRVFKNGPWAFGLSDITSFCGVNGGGKSSVLKTLLLLKQNFENTAPDHDNDGRLNFTGDVIDLGDFETFKAKGSRKNSDLKINIEHTGSLRKRYVRQIEKIKGKSYLEDLLSALGNKKTPEYELNASFDFTSESVLKKIQKSRKTLDSKRGILKHVSFDIKIEEMEFISIRVAFDKFDGADRAIYNISIPVDYYRAFGGEKVLSEIERKGQNLRFICVLSGLLPISLIGHAVGEGFESEKRKADFMFANLPPIFEEITRGLRHDFARLFYVGPVRAPGKRYYVLDSDVTPRLDHLGDFLPYTLRDRATKTIQASLPKDITRVRSVTLQKALNEWLYYFRTGSPLERGAPKEFASKFYGDRVGELTVKGICGSQHSLADSGYGYSQVIPIFVLCLLAPEKSTILIEQPELHLHPALQIRLTDFLISIASAQKRIVIETHSEHLINGLRVHAAEGLSSKADLSIGIYFLDFSKEKPIVHNLGIDDSGSIPDWPSSFFGEANSLTKRLLRAQREYLSKKKSKTG